MKVLGIITEYNPFHNGHRYHIQESQRITGARWVVCVMSGSFLQRGEPALLNKWARTKMALEMGVDLLLEIPSAYATRSAEAFAHGAVRLLEATGMVDYLSFGSELGDLNPLYALARILVEEPLVYKKALAHHLAEGLSYPRAQNLALYTVYPEGDALSSILENPNNILGIEYLKALYRQKSSMEVFTVKRRGSHYHEKTLKGAFSSATSIRSHLYRKKPLESIEGALPKGCLRVLTEEMEGGRGPIFLEDLTDYLLFLLRRTPPEELKEILGVGEGLENRLKEAALRATSLKDLLFTAKTRRYPLTRLQRIFIHLFIKYTSREARAFDAGGGPRYLRILGFTSRGQEILHHMRKKAWLPCINRVAPFYHQSFGLTKKMLGMDILATDLHGLLYSRKEEGLPGQDFRKGPIILK